MELAGEGRKEDFVDTQVYQGGKGVRGENYLE